ncbi:MULTISPECIES: glycosyltransferase family 4 protein [Brucella/Ochrobactrum group]|uniref:Glycosyl transferase group 1 n=1 Tax=Brucella anthropi (strain ATCC 49188 / DSM 6882 / CCUG 24695 / JCM 21032 / LMG 3331 / NBRC 15819 / NCTC 12168 / Alc 37) TaxID=439375 RepID=A6X4I4_BRUA4|nr:MULTISPECIES: glycosyltransferase family 4 protein [Brucella/Ochrobactrum group]ABS16138.1 glycosyl transferase group 1 [Brucella anthropi ATCC 49188]AIK42313.1 glycosyl transferases group 1 family protein [Brucella anthropi]KAB2742039.1 glycosyltransferase family 4 protein [Brucella anthropi]KAB2754585.1 glycosyltransferase family 4 protein [Brucella anthropi]KAB2765251.1 glycosyltransferase family 4 protein [Brucella anthropi]
MAQRVLIAAHNHPSLHPGGTEIFAHDLFRAYQRAGCEAMFMGATNKVHREARPGTSFQSIGNGGDEILLWSGHFDRFYMSQIDLYGIVPDIVELLQDFRPDVVHLHHLLLLGVEFPHIVRRTLPDCRIILTLHDYYPICHHDGLMVRTTGKELCHGAGPDRCHACFKDIALDKFVLRERHIKSLLSAVDAFVSPSEFLKQRYVEWGLAEEQISVIPNGQPERPAAETRQVERNKPVFGYFGNLNPWKGATVLLEAAQQLISEGFDFELRVHGAAPFQSESFVSEIDRLFAETSPFVQRRGAYRREDIAQLIQSVDCAIMPSIWWENAPLVIQEAQGQNRPVICSNIGGMAEMIENEVNGLTVPPNDPLALAQAMRRMAENPDLRQSLSENARHPDTIDTTAARYLDLIGTLRIARVEAA